VISPATGYLWSVDALSPANVWAGGDYGRFYHWDGNAWTDLDTAYSDIESIDMITNANGWATAGETILHWDGNSWSIMPSPTHAWLYSIEMISPNSGWIPGSSGTFLRYENVTHTFIPMIQQ
jgi:hypothetical protein